MKKISALFIDFDGTLVDSLYLMKSVFNQFTRLHGISDTACRFEEFNGPTISEIINTLINKYHLNGSAESMLDEYKNILSNQYVKTMPALGSVDILRLAKEYGIRVSVVTSNYRSLVLRWLEEWSLDQYIDEVITAEDAIKGKPDPALYLAALKSAGCQLDDVIAIEDSIQGAKSAISAQIETYCIKSKGIDCAAVNKDISNIHWINDLRCFKRVITDRMNHS